MYLPRKLRENTHSGFFNKSIASRNIFLRSKGPTRGLRFVVYRLETNQSKVECRSIRFAIGVARFHTLDLVYLICQ